MTLKLEYEPMSKIKENASIDILGDNQENERLDTISTEVISNDEYLSTDNNLDTWDNYPKFTEKQSESSSDNTWENTNEYISKTSLSAKDLEIVNSLLETLGYKENDLIRIRGFYKDEDEKTKIITISIPYPLKEEFYLHNKTAYYYLPNSYGQISDIPNLKNTIYNQNTYGYCQDHIPEGRTHYMEFDNLTYEEQLTVVEKLKLPKPTLAIDTGGKSIHYYWILKTPTEAKKWRALQDKLMGYLSSSDTSLSDICQLMRLPQCSYFSYKTQKYSGKETKILEELCDRTLKYNPEDLEKVIDENTPNNSSVIRTSVNKNSTNPNQVPNLVVLLGELGLNLPTDDYLATALENEFLNVANLTDDRNNYLNTACFNLGQLVNQGLDKDLIETVMLQASHINGKLKDSRKEITKNTIKIGIKSGIKKPRSDRPSSKNKLNNPKEVKEQIIQILTTNKSDEEQLSDILETIAPDTKKGTIYQLIKNAYGKRLFYNEFNLQVELDQQLADLENFYITLARDNNIETTKEFAFDTAIEIAKENRYNPLKDYFKELENRQDLPKVDIKKLSTLFFNTKESIYDTYLYKHLIGSVARIFQAGCKKDEVLVLKGLQGELKSSFFKSLYGEKFFTDSVKGTDKDNLLILHQCWCAELAELDHITSKKESGELKAFITTARDDFREPYGRISKKRPRQSVLVASVNKEEFLVDETGNRRFWIIPVNQRIDITLVEKLRNAIWKQAYQAYLQGEQWYLNTVEHELSNRLNEQYKSADAWNNEQLHNFLKQYENIGISAYEVLLMFFKKEPKDINNADNKRMTNIFSELGWQKKPTQQIREGQRRRVWYNSHALNNIIEDDKNPITPQEKDKIKEMLGTFINELHIMNYPSDNKTVNFDDYTIEQLWEEKNDQMSLLTRKVCKP